MTATLNQIPQDKSLCKFDHEDFVRELLRRKDIDEGIITEVLDNGLTDEITRDLECRGLTYEDIVVIMKALKKRDRDSNDSCDCTFKSEITNSRVTNQESDYLREQLGNILSIALREVAMKKPFDPIEYLGHWLLYYRECEERERMKKEFEAELLEERLKWQKDAVICKVLDDHEYEDEGFVHGGCTDDQIVDSDICRW